MGLCYVPFDSLLIAEGTCYHLPTISTQSRWIWFLEGSHSPVLPIFRFWFSGMLGSEGPRLNIPIPLLLVKMTCPLLPFTTCYFPPFIYPVVLVFSHPVFVADTPELGFLLCSTFTILIFIAESIWFCTWSAIPLPTGFLMFPLYISTVLSLIPHSD